MAELLFLGEEHGNVTSVFFYVIFPLFPFLLTVQLCGYDTSGRSHNKEVHHLEESS